MKLNNKILKATILFGLFSAIAFLMLITNSDSFSAWLIFFGSLSLFIALIWKLWKFRFSDPQIDPDLRNLIVIKFREESIYYPNGYYYRWSNVKTNLEISASRISEVNLNTFPPSFVLDNKEVIFVTANDRENLENFAKSNGIPIIERPEIWEMICEPFLDTEFDEKHQKQTIEILVNNGLSEKEITDIRKKIGKRMLFVNSFVWDWTHIGQQDYLNWTLFMNKRKYWWSMEIALRNFKNESKDTVKTKP